MGGKNRSWLEIKIDILNSGDLTVDEVAGFVADFFQKPAEQRGRIIRVYEESDDSIGLSRLKAALKSLGVEAEISVGSFSDRFWEQEWKKHLKPLYVGEGILVRPSWLSVEGHENRTEIVIDPGMAFGTGHHETTLLCLQWLDDFCGGQKVKNRSLLDVGTGSGILAITAAKLGFDPVVSLDIDPEAVNVAAGNVALNDVESKVLLIAGDIGSLKRRFDVIMANIQAEVLKEMAHRFVSLVRRGPQSFVVLSGVLDFQYEDVISAYESSGFRFEKSNRLGEWCLIAFKPPFDEA
ncbi:50S ribosomal protein L11 methyltransferase [Thermodesulforhabdus norvegica]|nr:50S ribosomal protein L11 methyltransferase [Thermodesulforhabdus norvegica]